jgi:hypothetical protein
MSIISPFSKGIHSAPMHPVCVEVRLALGPVMSNFFHVSAFHVTLGIGVEALSLFHRMISLYHIHQTLQ